MIILAYMAITYLALGFGVTVISYRVSKDTGVEDGPLTIATMIKGSLVGLPIFIVLMTQKPK